MGNAGLGLAERAEYVRAKQGQARQSPQAPVCCIHTASLRAWSEAAKAGHREESTGRGHRHEPELCQNACRKQMLRNAQGPVLDRCQGLCLMI